MNTRTSTDKSILLTDFAILGIFYVALIAFHGYRYGDGDMTETLSYAMWLRDPSLFAHDFYIQAISQHLVNPRLPFTLLMYPFVGYLDWACFILHLLTTLLFLAGWLRLGRIFLSNDGLIVLWMCTFLFLFYNINLGGNEAWYYYFVPSQLAKALGIWALVFFLQQRWLAVFVLLIPTTFIQPIVGAQLALVFGSLYSWQSLRDRKITLAGSIGLMVYALTAGLWLLAMISFQGSEGPALKEVSYFGIMETRMAHHFFPSYFPAKSWIILAPLIVLGCFLWQRISTDLFRFFTLAVLGLILYSFAIEYLELTAALNLQWFKVTIWLKPLALLAIFVQMDNLDKRGISIRWTSSLLTLILTASIMQLSGLYPIRPSAPLHLPFLSATTEEMHLAELALQKLPRDACVIAPPTVTAFRQHSRLSLFIDYKSSAHDRNYLYEAYRRRKELYGMNIAMRRKGTDMIYSGNQYYHALKKEDFQSHRIDGATHVLLEKGKVLDLPLIVQDSVFSIYQL